MAVTTDQVIVNTPSGTGHSVSAHQQATNNTTDSAGNFTSTNVGASAVQISGVETGRGSLKITHTGPGDNSDANASALSLWLAGANTAAQGLHIDGTGTTGALLDVRSGGVQLLKLMPDGTLHLKVGAQIKYDL